MAVTEAIWVTRKITTKRHLRGLLEGLNRADTLDLTQVTIMVLDDTHVIRVDPPMVRTPMVITQDNLPPEGLLVMPDDE
jgi:hypothetical protein